MQARTGDIMRLKYYDTGDEPPEEIGGEINAYKIEVETHWLELGTLHIELDKEEAKEIVDELNREFDLNYFNIDDALRRGSLEEYMSSKTEEDSK